MSPELFALAALYFTVPVLIMIFARDGRDLGLIGVIAVVLLWLPVILIEAYKRTRQ